MREFLIALAVVIAAELSPAATGDCYWNASAISVGSAKIVKLPGQVVQLYMENN